MAKSGQKSQINQEPKETSTQFVITSRQSAAIIICTIIGASILTLPRTVSAITHQGAWVSTLIGGIIAILLIGIVTKLNMRFQGQTVVEYTAIILGTDRAPVIGKLLSAPILFILIIFWIVEPAVITRIFGEVIVSAILPNTPIEAILITMLFAVYFLIIVEVEVIGRFNELAFFVIFITGFVITFMTMKNIQWTNVVPFFTVGPVSFLKGSFTTAFAYQGFVVMMMFLAYSQKEKNVATNMAAMGLVTLNYVLIVFTCVAVFGFEELQHLTWPVLEVVKSTDFASFLLERLDGLFLALWVAAAYTSIGNVYYAACLAIAQWLPFKKKNSARKWIGLILLPLIYAMALEPDSVQQLFRWSEYLGYYCVITFAIPVILYVIALIRRKRRKGENHGKMASQENQSKT